ncbi:MAG: hypothetical protein D6706_01485 [Chloroflexi bacterium]|nr:MAG: hypothetical protein D6706_01485 [Chloroflexota bacterium]
MATQTYQFDRVFVIHLRSYGFFHSGKERLVVQVLKRTWDFIPGSTLYGALSAALIRLDPPDEDLNHTVPAKGKGDYFKLLRAVEQGHIRFTPLLPAAEALQTGPAYCEQAMRLAQGGTPEGEQKKPSAQIAGRLLHTTPHAPLARPTEQIHSDRLYAIRTHRPHLDYYGFIFGRAEQRAWLEKGLRFLPFIPIGGRGKFSSIEGDVAAECNLSDFEKELYEWAASRWRVNNDHQGWLRLLTPLVIPKAGIVELLNSEITQEVIMTRFQRYRVWRTGRYFNGEAFDAPVGVGPYYDGATDALLQAGGAESVAVRAVPENSRFQMKMKNLPQAVRWFIEGTGHPGWRYLGWGQVVIE